VQKLYSANRGPHVVPILEKGKALTGQDSLYASAIINNTIKEVRLKFVNIQAKPMTVNISLKGAKLSKNTAVAQVLTVE
jgi:alpha-N-arabinofuranosidase